MLRSSTFAWHSSRVRGPLSVLVLSSAFACAADAPEAKQEGPEALQLQGARDDAAIVSISAFGSGCPAGTAEATIARDGASATVRFTRFEATVDSSAAVSVKDCQLAITLRDTEETQYQVSSTLVGMADIAAGQEARILQLGYLQGNAGDTERAVRELDGPLDGRFEFSASNAAVSTSCGPARDVNLRTVIRLQNADAKKAGHVSFSDGDAVQTITVTSQRCP